MSEPTNTWNAAYEASPAGTGLISAGDDQIRALKQNIRERLEREHHRDASDKTDDGVHRQGSAVAFYQAAAPSTRVDGTALTSDDYGRIWVDSDDNAVYIYTASGWVALSADDLTVGGNALDTLVDQAVTSGATVTFGTVTATSLDGSPIGTVSAKSADYTITDTDGNSTILVTTGATNRTITLPTAADNTGRQLTVKKVDSGAGYVVVDGEGAETIDGQATLSVEVENAGLTLLCDGSNWQVVNTINCEILSIGGTLELVYTKVLTGTTDADTSTSVTHGVDHDKVVSISAMIKFSVGDRYFFNEVNATAGSGYAYFAILDGSTVDFTNVGVYGQGQAYRIEIKYWV